MSGMRRFNFHKLYKNVLFCPKSEHFVYSELPFPSRCDNMQAWSASPPAIETEGKR